MSSFNGVNQYVRSPFITWGPSGTVATFGAWFTALTSVGQRCLFSTTAQGNIGQMMLYWDDSGVAALQIRGSFNAGDGRWRMTTPFATLTGWKWACVAWDARTTANKPILYTIEDGVFKVLIVGAGLTEISPPFGIGSNWPGSDNPRDPVIGNGINYQLPWSGKIGEFFLYKRLLGENEVRSVAHRGVRSIPGAYNYLPLDVLRDKDYGTSGLTWQTVATAAEKPPARAWSGALTMVG